MFFVYILKSENNWRFYVGMTSNLEKRIEEHNKGYTKSTKGYRPWKLFFFETFQSRAEARSREKYYKSGIGKEKIKQKWSSSSAACLPTGRDRATGKEKEL
jgi:putative endonuclease